MRAPPGFAVSSSVAAEAFDFEFSGLTAPSEAARHDRMLRAARCFEAAGETRHAAACLKRGRYRSAAGYLGELKKGHVKVRSGDVGSQRPRFPS